MSEHSLSPQEIQEHEARIDRQLRVVYRREGFEVVDRRTPLSDIFARELTAESEQDEDLQELQTQMRNIAFGKLIDFFFEDGAHPGVVMRKVYIIAHCLRPEVTAHMTAADMARLFGETRAAMSWRIDKIFSGYLKAAGQKGFRATSQRGNEARANCAAAQRGNTNRRKKRPSEKTRKPCIKSASSNGRG